MEKTKSKQSELGQKLEGLEETIQKTEERKINVYQGRRKDSNENIYFISYLNLEGNKAGEEKSIATFPEQLYHLFSLSIDYLKNKGLKPKIVSDAPRPENGFFYEKLSAEPLSKILALDAGGPNYHEEFGRIKFHRPFGLNTEKTIEICREAMRRVYGIASGDIQTQKSESGDDVLYSSGNTDDKALAVLRFDNNNFALKPSSRCKEINYNVFCELKDYINNISMKGGK